MCVQRCPESLWGPGSAACGRSVRASEAKSDRRPIFDMSEKKPPSSNCHKCKKSVAGCKVICAGQKCFHVDCFCCTVCSTKLSLKYCEVEGEPYCHGCWFSKFAPKCHGKLGYGFSISSRSDRCVLPSGCQKAIEGTECVTILGKDYHQDCAKCTKCQAMLSGDQYFPYKETAYCFDCHWKVRMEVHEQRQQQVALIKKSGTT